MQLAAALFLPTTTPPTPINSEYQRIHSYESQIHFFSQESGISLQALHAPSGNTQLSRRDSESKRKNQSDVLANQLGQMNVNIHDYFKPPSDTTRSPDPPAQVQPAPVDLLEEYKREQIELSMKRK